MANTLSLHNADAWPVILTPKQVAEILQIGRTRAYELCHQRGFPARRIGKTFRIPKMALLEWLDTHETDNHA
jgi:excisionase family DNA binding protein